MPELKEIRGKVQEVFCPLSGENCKKRCMFYHTEYISGNFKDCLLKKVMITIQEKLWDD